MIDNIYSRRRELQSFLHMLQDMRAVAGSNEDTYHYLEGIDYCIGWVQCTLSSYSYPDIFDGGDSDAERK